MSDNLISRHPQIEFVRSCNLCPHMQRITLDGILASLAFGHYEVHVEETIAVRARRAIDAMLALPDPATPADFTRPAHDAHVEVVS